MHAEDVARILRQNVVQGQRLEEEGEKYREWCLSHQNIEMDISGEGERLWA